MVDEEDFGVLDDKDGDGEIDLFVNVGHNRAGEINSRKVRYRGSSRLRLGHPLRRP